MLSFERLYIKMQNTTGSALQTLYIFVYLFFFKAGLEPTVALKKNLIMNHLASSIKSTSRFLLLILLIIIV